MMMDHPIDEGDVKSNVPASFFAQNPFVAEYFLSLSARCLVKPRLYEASPNSFSNQLFNDLPKDLPSSCTRFIETIHQTWSAKFTV
jgi:hypothetical protein